VTATRWWPRSLFGRVVLILFAGLAAAQGLAFALAQVERGLAMRGMMMSYLASDLASSVAMLDRLPPAERPAWLPRLARRNYRFALLEDRAERPAASALAAPVVRELAQSLQREVWTAQGVDGSQRIRLRLADATPVTIHFIEPGLVVSPWALAALVGQLALLGALGWLAVKIATRPLLQLADAADALQPDSPGQVLPVDGPVEVARAARAFNAMQARIQAHLDERMRILAAVSHDLQTPITRLRLRADLSMEDTALRDKVHADLAEMQSLVEEGIAYARSAHAVREEAKPVDVSAFLESIVSDYADAGRNVELRALPATHFVTRPHALRRLLCNLLDNALKFAGAARVEAAVTGEGGLHVSVLDRGPGIPEEHRSAVLQPFVRLEDSRSRDTGGTGLGLAIANQLAQALDGRLVLGDRAGGGLEARLELRPPLPGRS
jgi:signal transduction histidine kinase